MEVVSDMPGGPGAEIFTRDAMVQMFNEFRNEIISLLNNDVGLVKSQLTCLRSDHDSLQQAVADLKAKVHDLRHPSILPTTPEESSAVSKSRSNFSSAPAKKNAPAVRIFSRFWFLEFYFVFRLFFTINKIF